MPFIEKYLLFNFALLCSRAWACDLSCENDESGFEHNSTHAFFSIEITLTEQGLAELDQVIQAVFQYIKMLKECGPNERIWRDIQAIETLSSRYEEDSPPIDNVSNLSENMQLFDPIDYLNGDLLFFEYNPQVRFTALSLRLLARVLKASWFY